MAGVTTIRAADLGQVNTEQGVILDVRTRMEHAEKHIGFTHAHVPLDELKPSDFMTSRGLDRGACVYILCRSGGRAAQAAAKFAAEGYGNVKIVEGGLVACEDCGHPMEGYGAAGAAQKVRGPISLERQVRIAAGLFAATGAALALAIHPFYAAIPLFVGCGLVFAGITDRCGMALILAKAPWNRIEGAVCMRPGSSGKEKT